MRKVNIQDLANCPSAWSFFFPRIALDPARKGELYVDEKLFTERIVNCPPLTAEQIGLRAKKIIPIPRAEWPLPIKALALLARSSDKGIGDVIARLIGPVGGDAYKAWFQSKFGKPCGCSERQSDLNAKYGDYPLTPRSLLDFIG